VLEVIFGAHRLLLTGDLPATEEAGLVARHRSLQASLVSAPHHGSRHSSSEAFVTAVRPRWVLVQAGYRNRFGHPDAGVVARYRAGGAEVVRTDHSGALQWRFPRAGDPTLVAARRAEARYWHNRPLDQGAGQDGDPDTDNALRTTGSPDPVAPDPP
jgi:competence protein ComEC